MSATLTRSSDGFISAYEGLRGRLPGEAGERAQAAAAFARLGLPGRRLEAWKYTPLRVMSEMRFAEPMTSVGEPPALLDRLTLLDAPRLVYVDGRFRAELSAPVAERFATHPDFGHLARPDRDAFAALNTMLAEDGARIMVPPGVDGGVLHLISLTTGAPDRPVATHPRHHVELGAGARLTLVEIGCGQGVYLHNRLTDIVVGEAAQLSHLRLQDEAADAFQVSTLYVEIAKSAVYDSFLLNMGAQLSRNEVHARIGGADAVVRLDCAQLLRGRQHGDFTTTLTHDAPGGRSRQTVRNVLDGAARGVFQGRINVSRVAQKTDGYQMNHTLLLSPETEVDSKPELRINADDVKCSHGATVGELDMNQMFYLRSRGVPEPEARATLIRGFLSESLSGIADDEIRALFERAVDDWWERERA